ncbi:MAG: type II toxin-antitoxin system RelE/ParE family toxin [Taibaiella sp.]|nr:type II toxin-antitoxin system RelE/ParE family toxin [Taibaiella sp.]
MQHKIILTTEAQLDAINAVGYYTAISNDLADRFESELYFTYTKISANPQYFKYLTKGKKKKFRCTKLKSFPFLVIYRFEEPFIVIIAVFNTHRKPDYGQP